MRKEIPAKYNIVKHPITGEDVRVHGASPVSWGFIGKRGTGYKGLGKQIPLIGTTQDKNYYNIETGEIKRL